jgi:CheY-like chemotaxis protein
MKKILIVDDQPAVLRVLRLGLEQAGYTVETAFNGAEALGLLAEGFPDFMVTDIDMPGMGGRELCMAILERHPERPFQIVVLTSRSELEHRSWTASLPKLTFIEKPVSMRQLLAHIGGTLGQPVADSVA